MTSLKQKGFSAEPLPANSIGWPNTLPNQGTATRVGTRTQLFSLGEPLVLLALCPSDDELDLSCACQELNVSKQANLLSIASYFLSSSFI